MNLYRVSYRVPKELIESGGFKGTASTVLPPVPKGMDAWTEGSFCAATLDGIDPDEMKVALRRFSPPQAFDGRDTPYLYRFDADDDSIVALDTLPDHCFFEAKTKGFGKEIVVTKPVGASRIEI
jgi:hypothetical protein